MKELKSEKNERMWDKLLSKIENGHVIPIIGSELFCINVGNQCMHINEYIIRKIVDILDIKYDELPTFTELAGKKYAYEWEKIDSDLYYATNQILKEMANLQVQSSDALQKLLSIDKFKIVLTTAFDDWSFKTMEEKWGKGKVKKLTYKKHSSGEDVGDLSSPLLYYLFGEANPNENTFVLTEDDLLDFLHDWMNDNYRPKRLSNMLREKYLLVIGCNYPNWLFRFFIHSMKDYLRSSGDKGMVADSKLDKNLDAFLSRKSIQKHENTIEFIDELVERWANRPKSNNKDKRDIFISYASEDEEIAIEITRIFQAKGASVWLDKEELYPGEDYDKVIQQHIKECKAFVPILSNHTLTSERRFFKAEWTRATDELRMRGTKKFIFPIRIEDIDLLSNELPEEFRRVTMVDFSKKDILEDNIQKIIRDFRS